MAKKIKLRPEFEEKQNARDRSRDRDGWQAKRREDRRAKGKRAGVEGAEALKSGWR